MYKKLLNSTILLATAALLSSCATDPVIKSFNEARVNYQSENYQLAYQELLVPAAKGNIDAQYALGYLYYSGKGIETNRVLGEYWIKKAALAGNINAQQALKVILSNQQNIYSKHSTNPAKMESLQAELNTVHQKTIATKVVASLPKPTEKATFKKLAKPKNQKVKALASHHSAHENHILAIPAHHYTIQLFDASSLFNAKNFVHKYSLSKHALIFKRTIGKKHLYVVIYGNFSTHALAQHGEALLPKTVRALKPWIRPISSVQAEIKDDTK